VLNLFFSSCFFIFAFFFFDPNIGVQIHEKIKKSKKKEKKEKAKKKK